MTTTGEILKRKISIFNLIGLSAVIILMAKPNQIFNAGFVFSYAAVLSIVIMAPIFYRFFSTGDKPVAVGTAWVKIRTYILKSIAVSLAAWLGLLPLIAYYFGLVSPVVVIANLIVVPLLFVIMGSGILFIWAGMLSKLLAGVFSQSTWFFLSALVKSITLLARLPFGYFEIETPPQGAVIAYYIVLSAAIWKARGFNTGKT